MKRLNTQTHDGRAANCFLSLSLSLAGETRTFLVRLIRVCLSECARLCECASCKINPRFMSFKRYSNVLLEVHVNQTVSKCTGNAELFNQILI